MKKPKTLYIIIGIIGGGILLLGLYKLANLFSPGSYPHREEYIINASEAEIIKAIQAFKSENSEYVLPSQSYLFDGRTNEVGLDYWYHIYFYYKDENKIINCWTRPINEEKTTFAFISINNGLTLGNWKDINKDFSRSENKKEKKKFEERILAKINQKLNQSSNQ